MDRHWEEQRSAEWVLHHDDEDRYQDELHTDDDHHHGNGHDNDGDKDGDDNDKRPRGCRQPGRLVRHGPAAHGRAPGGRSACDRCGGPSRGRVRGRARTPCPEPGNALAPMTGGLPLPTWATPSPSPNQPA
ncbi:MAG: hypothetical protein M1826_004968, partial [Phylliscum demangeonii]